MTELLKFPSIENTYDQKNIDYWLNRFPELENELFLITSKIDGSNFSIIITEDEIKYASRNRIIEENDSFFNYKEVVKRYERDINLFQKHLIKFGLNKIQITCELFGKGIFNRVQYFQENRLRILSVAIDDKWLSPSALMILIMSVGLTGLNNKGEVDNTFSEALVLAPKITRVAGLKEALSYNCEHKSLINRDIKGDNFEEGIVIQPYSKNFYFTNSDGNEKIFILKSKHPKFAEKMKANNIKDDKQVELSPQSLLIKEYINESRVVSVISKYGQMASFSDIPKYLQFVKDDIYQDIIKEHQLSLNDFKSSFKPLNHEVVKLLKGVN